jgi:hypothetical protein
VIMRKHRVTHWSACLARHTAILCEHYQRMFWSVIDSRIGPV